MLWIIMKGFLVARCNFAKNLFWYSELSRFFSYTLRRTESLIFFLKNTRHCSQDYIWVNVRLKTTDYFVIVTDYFVYPGISLQDSKGWTSSPN